MRKVFFLGCNHDQVPYLKAARNLGFKIIATDMNPKAPGAELADQFHAVSYTDVEGLLRVAQKETWNPDDRIFTAAAHFAYEGASNLACRLGIPFIQPEMADTCLDKSKFYILLNQYDIKVPPTELIDPKARIQVSSEKTYYLKSDYGKTPKYCFRVSDGILPKLPEKHDAFYRKYFLLQEEIKGMHFRINLYHDQVSIFYKFTDNAAAPFFWLGPGHAEVVEKLRKVVNHMGMAGYLTKFDLIVDEENWYVIDMGLDPPMRMKLLCDYLHMDFESAYTRYYLLNDPSCMPVWGEICKPVVIHGSPETGFSYFAMEK